MADLTSADLPLPLCPVTSTKVSGVSANQDTNFPVFSGSSAQTELSGFILPVEEGEDTRRAQVSFLSHLYILYSSGLNRCVTLDVIKNARTGSNTA